MLAAKLEIIDFIRVQITATPIDTASSKSALSVLVIAIKAR